MILEALEGTHPRRLLEEGRGDEFVDRMADGLLTFAAGFSPRPVTYRTIDFRTNEFRGLAGGDELRARGGQPDDRLPRRASLRARARPARLELDAVGRVYDAGYANLHVMLPFVRTAPRAGGLPELVRESGLTERRGFELWVMAEVPSVLFNLAALRRRSASPASRSAPTT